MYYGTSPDDLGLVDIECPEMMYYQYLPVFIPENPQGFSMPNNLKWMIPLFNKALTQIPYPDRLEYYAYITVKSMYCTPGTSNRPGWHSDGFGTNDINYIWYDSMPTEFCIQEFDLSPDHIESMKEMEEQADIDNIEIYPNKHLLELDEFVIHRCAVNATPGYRTFVKISFSKERYNLKGNSHNYGLSYKWDMIERQQERNHPIANVN